LSYNPTFCIHIIIFT
jgi:hypothetical protein